MMPQSHRLPGLDLVRTVAILLVLWDHGIRFLPSSVFGTLSPHPLPDGVDLFFVLSGWLVTGSLFEKITHSPFSIKHVFTFYASRWLRTLPAYWVVLGVNVLLLSLHATQGLLNKNAVFYVVFLQNFHKPLDLFFWESWSLSVEEWFYISFPLLLLPGVLVLKKPQIAFLFTCLLFVAFGFTARLFYFTENPSLDADLYFRKLVLCRLDMIAWGGLAYYLFKKGIWPARFGFILLLLSLGLWVWSESLSGPFLEKVISFSLSGLAIALGMPYVATLNVSSAFFRKTVEFISRISYSLYLVHLGIVAGLLKTCWPEHTGWWVWAVYITVSFIGAYLLYISIEKPFLQWREKWLPRP